MRNRFVHAALSAALLVTFGYARQSSDKSKIVIPYQRTSPTDGKQMYKNYCAPCHGLDGKGHGPVASSLRQPPTDLTLLARNNHGKFPESHVAGVLSFGTDHPAHGSATMPVWGPILGRMDRANVDLEHMRIVNLCNYLRTIQQK
ncbi:MAG TPA: cytochrome c [Terracidiphilus sp.]|nr:cytochrome c [Terracidiphilus sp.]